MWWNRERFFCSIFVVLPLVTVSPVVASSHVTILYTGTSPDGTRIGPAVATGDQVSVQYGSSLKLFLDERINCSALLEDIQPTDMWKKAEILKGRPLPIIVTSGEGCHISKPGRVVLRVKVVGCGVSDEGVEAHEEVVLEFVESRRWWSVADTVAYAVTRDSGNTAIAGAGLFVDVPCTKRLRGIVQLSFVVHLLPPARQGDASDIGLSPIGIGLFGNRIVLGTGWNISRWRLRPNEHNRYIYIGFSVSRLLNPTPP